MQAPIRKRGRRIKKELLELDITSLLDILVILLVFLLKSYNSSPIVINVPKEITIPKSESYSPNNAGVMVQMSKDKLWVESKEIVDFLDKKGKVYGHGGRLIVPLYDELVKIKEEVNLVNEQANIEKKFSGVANLILDKSVKYIDVKRILYTAAEAGFQKYKFVVMSEEEI